MSVKQCMFWNSSKSGRVKAPNICQICNHFIINPRYSNRLELLENWYFCLPEGKLFCKGFWINSSFDLLLCSYWFCHSFWSTFVIYCFIWSYKASRRLVMWRMLYKWDVVARKNNPCLFITNSWQVVCFSHNKPL